MSVYKKMCLLERVKFLIHVYPVVQESTDKIIVHTVVKDLKEIIRDLDVEKK